MARQINTNKDSNGNQWVEVTQGVSVRKSGSSDYFSINWFGAIIHGCQIRTGQSGEFISWPAFKNADGKYIKRAYIWADRGSDDERILDRIVSTVKSL